MIQTANDMSQSTHQRRRAHEETRSCFIVHAAGCIFGLPVDSVQTIFRLQEITPVPLGPSIISGLVNLRGKIVTAISLERRLCLESDDAGASTPLAVAIDCGGESYALVVDAVGDAITCREEDRIAAPRHITDERARLTEAYYRMDNAILPVLDLSALFDIAVTLRVKPESPVLADSCAPRGKI